MIGDCPDFPVPGEENGTVPLSEIILLDAVKPHSQVIRHEMLSSDRFGTIRGRRTCG